jgi:fluoride exporter
MKIFWAVALGAAAGGLSRFYITVAMQERLGDAFPWGTLLINITGSLLLGFVIRYAMAASMPIELRLLLTTGFCGGYTTFSSYSLETAVLIESGQYGRAAAYSLGSVVLSLLATFCGFMLARALFGADAPG